MTYHFYQKKMKIKEYQKLVCNFYDKEKYVVHIRTLKKALNPALILKTVCKVIIFKEKAGLKLVLI